MVSNFLVQHPSGPCLFQMWNSSMHATNILLSLYHMIWTTWNTRLLPRINVGQDGYFDNNTVLTQFERLLALLSFKRDVKDLEIEVVVDNARTYSAREYSVNDFSKVIDIKCPMDVIEYVGNQGRLVSVPCYFTRGKHHGKPKGLVELAKDLNAPIRPSMTLSEIRALLSSHPAFQNISRLETSARKYQVEVIHLLLNSSVNWTQPRAYGVISRWINPIPDPIESDRILPTDKIRWDSWLWDHCRIRPTNPIFLFQC